MIIITIIIILNLHVTFLHAYDFQNGWDFYSVLLLVVVGVVVVGVVVCVWCVCSCPQSLCIHQ